MMAIMTVWAGVAALAIPAKWMETAVAVSGSPAAAIAVKGTLALSAGLAVAWAVRRARAAVRHAILSALFATLAMLPPAMWLAPQVKVPVQLAPQPATR